MEAEEASINIHDHGVLVNKQRRRVRCNYCSKEMSGFSRLKYHLGGVGTDVLSCPSVPEHVKDSFRNLLLQTKTTCLSEEVRGLLNPDLPLKRKLSPDSNDTEHDNHSVSSPSEMHAEMDYRSKNGVAEHLLANNSRGGKQTALNTKFHGEISSREIQKYIARFFYETGTDFRIANSPSFKRMITAVHGDGQLIIPTSRELEGAFEDELKEVQEYVNKVRHSWASTGCSVLLDGWVDETGRILVNFVVECPEGPIYLRSADVSAIVDDADALQLLLEEVIEVVGENNVIQIVACSTTGWMGAVGKQFLERHRTVFWSVSASHCINLMLENIGEMDSIRRLMEKAKVITRFIYGHSEVLKLMRSHTHDYDLVKHSSLKSVASFLTLENIVSEKENLMTMVSSIEWRISWDSTPEGVRVAHLVRDISFWTEAELALKGTVPLLRALELINKASEPQVGYIYETMARAKETIKEESKNKKSQYEPFWKVIDEIWDGFLHSPLHAAGYYLNPSLFYSTDFYNDSEVAFGLLSCIVLLFQDQQTQDKISVQLNDYRHAKGAFKEGSAVHKRTSIPPAQWWSTYGNECPELQNFAIRILSQTCDGAFKYGLERGFAKKLLTLGRNQNEQQSLSESAIRHNLNLRNRHFGLEFELLLDQIDSTNDWIIDLATKEVSQNVYSNCIDTGIKKEPPSTIEAREEMGDRRECSQKIDDLFNDENFDPFGNDNSYVPETYAVGAPVVGIATVGTDPNEPPYVHPSGVTCTIPIHLMTQYQLFEASKENNTILWILKPTNKWLEQTRSLSHNFQKCLINKN